MSQFTFIFPIMSSETQVKSLLDVVSFILERLTTSEAFDANILSDYFRKHYDIVDVHKKSSFQTETIIIPESAALHDDINNHEEEGQFSTQEFSAKSKLCIFYHFLMSRPSFLGLSIRQSFINYSKVVIATTDQTYSKQFR